MGRKHPLRQSRRRSSASQRRRRRPHSGPVRWLLRWAAGTVILAIAGIGLLWLLAPSTPSTFLILGMDQRPGETGPSRTDAILIAQVNPERNRSVLVSLPRDLWLPQPNGVANRINTAAVAGYDPNRPDAGIRYLAQTVEMNFDRPIHGSLTLNLASFVRIVDAAGGVTVDVPKLLIDPAYPTQDYGTTTVRFEPGLQHMDGDRALIYARTRHPDSDFGRSARQQQIIRALATRLLHPLAWPRLPAVATAFASAVQTDVPMYRYPALALFVFHAATDRLESLVLDGSYTTPWTTEGGAAVLLPRWDAITPRLEQIFY